MQTLREHRRHMGWSQKDLSKKAGVGQDTISAIESGHHEPRPSTLRKLARAFGVEVGELFKPPGQGRRYPELTLAPMYEALPANRERALRAATAEDVARYVSEIDTALRSAERAIEEWDGTALPDPPPDPPPRVLLMRYVLRLGQLRGEALLYAPHSGVAEIQDYPRREALGELIRA